jgi:phosphomannomutase
MLIDLFLRERAAGRWPASSAIAQFHELAGPSFYLRVDVHVERAAYPETKRRLLVDLAADSPSELAGEPVARTVPLDTGDGFKFFLADGSWLLVRASGTEPLVRIYTEATSADLRDALLVAGERLVRGS